MTKCQNYFINISLFQVSVDYGKDLDGREAELMRIFY